MSQNCLNTRYCLRVSIVPKIRRRILTHKNYVPALEPKIPIFPGMNGYLGIADNGYLYSWGDMDDSGRLISGAKDENGDWLNTSEKVLTPITPESNSKFGADE